MQPVLQQDDRPSGLHEAREAAKRLELRARLWGGRSYTRIDPVPAGGLFLSYIILFIFLSIESNLNLF